MPLRLSRRLWDDCIDFVLPQHCVVCGGFGASLHDDCLDRLSHAEGPRCARCWRPGAGTWCERCATADPEARPDMPAFDALRTPFRFEGDARRAVLEAKFRGVTAHLPPLARAAVDVVPREWRFDVVVGVPLARGRERRRGYNQAALLAREVAEATGARARADLVRRVRATPPQAGLSAERRARNLDGAFAVRGVPPEGVLVVDDVTTTGSTLSSMASVLKAAGAVRVYALAVARED
jgi:ComF family protein